MHAVMALLPLLLALGCAPLFTPVGIALTAGATGGTMAMQDRGIDGALSDNAIALEINDAWLKHDPAILRKVSTSINDGIVVLTGSVTYRETAQRAEVLARGVTGVRDVRNLIRVEQEPDLGTMASDRWITLRLRTDLTFAADIHAVNYAIDTVSGTVFLSGVARDQAELDRVVAHAKATPGVRDVVTAIRLRSEPLPQRGTSLASSAHPAPTPQPYPAQPYAAQPSMTQPSMTQPSMTQAPRSAAVVAREPLPPPR